MNIVNKESVEAYTLIETIVAMAIFLSVLLPLVGTKPRSLRVSK